MFLLARWDVRLLLLSIGAFVAFPEIDLAVTGWFYRPEASYPFPLHTHRGIAALDFVFAYALFVTFYLALAALLLARYVSRLRQAAIRRCAAFLLAALVLGPGLLVNAIAKETSGRARPKHVELFGGEQAFSPVLVPADQCDHNCSFVSGHASGAFFAMALAWVTRRRRWIAIGVVLGCVVGFARVAQGDHFLSDVVFAGWIVYGALLFAAQWAFGRVEPTARPLLVPDAAWRHALRIGT